MSATARLGAAAALLLASSAAARPSRHARLEVDTTAPISVGARLHLELPARLRLSTGVGVLPRAYVEALNEVAIAFGGYDEEVAAVIEESLASSMVWRSRLGWRPFAGAGLYLEGGYTLVALGGGASEARLIALAFGIDTPFDPDARYRVDLTLHLLEAEIGWEWWIADAISLRAGVGAATTLVAGARVERQERLPVLGAFFAETAERELVGIAERHVHTPTLGLALGWRFY